MDRPFRVAITGIGAVTPIGLNFPSSWEALLAGNSGIRKLSRFKGLKWEHGAELSGFDPLSVASKKDTLRYDPFALYALAASKEAASDSGLSEAALEEAGVIIGSSRGGIASLEDAARSRPNAYTMAGTTISMAASLAAARLNIKGHVSGISSACASGTAAIGTAFEMVRSGRLPIALAGGTEAPLCTLCQQGYGRSGALSKTGRLVPFQEGRDGFVLGEGAAVLVLEHMDLAKARGARIYAELSGYGNTSDAGHPTRPDPVGEAAAMRAAMNEAGLSPAAIGLLVAHATSTPLGDTAEEAAISKVFGNSPPVLCAVKPATGHMLAASGAFEAAIAANSLASGALPPSIGRASHAAPRAALANSFGFGGLNTVLSFRPAGDTI
jgi:3-oxoacyl-[acyl-carrier-protein] synthase II